MARTLSWYLATIVIGHYVASFILLQRLGWFQQKRRPHAVIEFGWDKVFGTYQAVER
jgi:hypothetical protein